MGKHKTAPVQSDGGWFIARRKGNRLRMQNRITGTMTKWAKIPEPSPEFLEGYVRNAAAETVPVLRARAERFGLRIPSKMRKAELLDILAVRSYYRSYQVGPWA